MELSELWDSYRSTTVAADASESDLELARSAFHGGVFALAQLLAHMDSKGEGDAALRMVRWISAKLMAELSAALCAIAAGRQ